jgi:hypothetical protein
MRFAPANDATHYLYKDPQNPKLRVRETRFFRQTHADRILYIPQTLLSPQSIRREIAAKSAPPNRGTVFFICEPDPYERFVVVADTFATKLSWCGQMVFRTAFDADMTDREDVNHFNDLLNRSTILVREKK